MRTPLNQVVPGLFVVGLLAALLTGPALAQCGMMGGGGGGGHDHGATQKSRAPQVSGSDRKLRQSIDRLLTDERGRVLLADALLGDRAFMDELVRRMTQLPELRAMAVQQLSAPAPAGASRADAPGAPAGPEPLFACPMHPDVTATRPGDCPKCGMPLSRREPGRE